MTDVFTEILRQPRMKQNAQSPQHDGSFISNGIPVLVRPAPPPRDGCGPAASASAWQMLGEIPMLLVRVRSKIYHSVRLPRPRYRASRNLWSSDPKPYI